MIKKEKIEQSVILGSIDKVEEPVIIESSVEGGALTITSQCGCG